MLLLLLTLLHDEGFLITSLQSGVRGIGFWLFGDGKTKFSFISVTIVGLVCVILVAVLVVDAVWFVCEVGFCDCWFSLLISCN